MTIPYQPPEQPPVQEPRPVSEPQPVYAPPIPPAYAQAQAFKLENAGVILLSVGVILIGTGIIVLGLAPGDMTINQSDFTPTPTEVHFGVQMTTLLIGCVMIGIGTILEGIGAAVTIKAHFAQREALSRR